MHKPSNILLAYVQTMIS